MINLAKNHPIVKINLSLNYCSTFFFKSPQSMSEFVLTVMSLFPIITQNAFLQPHLGVV